MNINIFSKRILKLFGISLMIPFTFFEINAINNQIKAEKRAVESNTSALKNTTEGYNAGNQTLLDVIDQQTNLYNANIQYVAGRVQYLEALSLLEQQAGTLKPGTLKHLQGWFH